MAEKDNVEPVKIFPPPSTGYRPRCFFDIHINKVEAGRLTFELFADICPKTCENFRALCTGEKGEGKTTSKPLHYKNNLLHRIVKGFIIQGGDFSAGDGTGGESIYGGTFKDENFELKHDRPFLLSMANRGPNTNGSQFFITLAAAHHLDNIHTIFGHVLFGQEIIRDVENQKVNSNHKPYADIRITHCGELIKKAKVLNKKSKTKSKAKSSSSESSSSSDSDSNHRNRGSKKKSKGSNVKERKGNANENEERNIDGEKKAENPDKLDLNFIPSVPSTFLMRRSRTPSPVRERRKKEGLSSGRRREPVLRTRVNMVSKSGKKLRGRGVMRYRTPTPESSEGSEVSDTPTKENAVEHRMRKRKEREDRPLYNQNREVVARINGGNADANYRNGRRARSKSAEKMHSERYRKTSRSRSRSRERRRRLSRSRSRRRSRSRDRKHRRSYSRSRYRRRSRSVERRRSRYRRSRSRSRRRSPRKRSRSVDGRRSSRNSSRERKGKFERHRSKSGSASDTSQERRKKGLKNDNGKTEKSSIKEKIDVLFQKNEEESKSVMADENSEKRIKEKAVPLSPSNNKKIPLSIDDVVRETGVLLDPPSPLGTYLKNYIHPFPNSNDIDNMKEGTNELPPHPQHETLADTLNVKHVTSPDFCINETKKVVHISSFPTGIQENTDEKISSTKTEAYGDDFIATTIEEENITGNLFDPKESSQAIKVPTFSIKVDKNVQISEAVVENMEAKENRENTDVIDEKLPIKSDFNDFQELIEVNKKIKKKENREVVKSASISLSGSDNEATLRRHRKSSRKSRKYSSRSENGKSEDSEVDYKTRKEKSKKKARGRSSSQVSSDEEMEKKRVKKRNSMKMGRRRRRSERSNASSSDNDEDAHSSKGSDAESLVEADRDRKSSKRSKRKHRRRYTESSDDSVSEHDKRRRHKRRRRKLESEYDEDDSDSEIEREKERRASRRSKHKRKKRISRSSSSDEESTDGYESSRKSKQKSYDRKKDRKKRKKRVSVSD